MTIRKGEAWGHPGALAAGGAVVRSDAEARHLLEAARAAGDAFPDLGLLGGDLARTLAAPGDVARLRSTEATTFPVDLGVATVDGRPHLFVAHAVVRNRWWTRAVVALNAQWIGDWNVGPRAHPNDGRLDIYDVRLAAGEIWKVRRRLPAGAHLPHPGIRERRSSSASFDLEHPLGVWLDGERVATSATIEFHIEPDALLVVI